MSHGRNTHRHKVNVDECEQARVQRGGIVCELSRAELDTAQRRRIYGVE